MSEVRVQHEGVESLPVALTDDERLTFGDELASVNQSIVVEEAREKSVKQQLKSTMAGLVARREVVSEILASKSEYREVKIQTLLDYDSEEFRKVRSDTGEVLMRRPMNDSERQLETF